MSNIINWFSTSSHFKFFLKIALHWRKCYYYKCSNSISKDNKISLKKYSIMPNITVNVSLYGSIARFGNGLQVAQINIELEAGSYLSTLLAELKIPEKERGYVFINSVLNGVPGLPTESDAPLQDGDHVGIFSVDRLWPYQYRDGIRMSKSLKKAMEQHGAMHHSYDTDQ